MIFRSQHQVFLKQTNTKPTRIFISLLFLFLSSATSLYNSPSGNDFKDHDIHNIHPNYSYQMTSDLLQCIHLILYTIIQITFNVLKSNEFT